MLDIESTRIGLIDVLLGEFMATFAHGYQPQEMFEGLVAPFIVAHNAYQGEGVLVHGSRFGLFFPASTDYARHESPLGTHCLDDWSPLESGSIQISSRGYEKNLTLHSHTNS